jgi:hypothetical protein
MVAWALWPLRPDKRRVGSWAALLAVGLAFGYGGSVALRELQLRHPQAKRIEALLDGLKLEGPLTLREGDAAIVARIDTPAGVVELA